MTKLLPQHFAIMIPFEGRNIDLHVEAFTETGQFPHHPEAKNVQWRASISNPGVIADSPDKALAKLTLALSQLVVQLETMRIG